MSEHRQMTLASTVRPGEIWLVEQSPTTSLAALDRDAIASANVILYDRALEPLVAEILPLGTYAEPLPSGEQGTGPVISSRALRFAADGWSVVQIVVSRPGWRQRVHAAADGLAPSRGSGELPVVVIAKAAPEPQQRREACVCNLPSLIEEFAGDDPLTLIFGPLAPRDPTPGQAFTANGLAG
jgi:siroheme synthase